MCVCDENLTKNQRTTYRAALCGGAFLEKRCHQLSAVLVDLNAWLLDDVWILFRLHERGAEEALETNNGVAKLLYFLGGGVIDQIIARASSYEQAMVEKLELGEQQLELGVVAFELVAETAVSSEELEQILKEEGMEHM